MAMFRAVWQLVALLALTTGEMLQNSGFESGMNHWDCWNAHCSISSDRHSGQHSIQINNRHQFYDSPSQEVRVEMGKEYHGEAWVKLLNDHNEQWIEIELDLRFDDGTHDYQTVAHHSNARSSEGWVHLQGDFVAPTHKSIHQVRFYVQSGPSASVNFLVDDASVTSTGGSGVTYNHVISQQRQSPIVLNVTTAHGINKDDVRIHVVQTKKSFPFGTAVNSWKYNANDAGGKYRDFIHKHFNWIVPENALKWGTIEPHRGQKNYHLALDMIHGVMRHGIKVRGHNLVWSVPQFVQDWVKQLHGNDLRNEVKHHIEEVMNKTRGLALHWDVNNENLHGRWYQDALHDPSYNLELFRIAQRADPTVKLFLNDYNVVAWGSETNSYLNQARQFKNANVGLYGIGVQCHFGNEDNPNPAVIKQRLDTLAQVGLPIWVTELDVQAQDENRRADFYERALRAFYEHPSVEGILFWGFWDQAHWRGEKAALVRGNNLDLTAAGRRVLDLFENQWMTDTTVPLPQSGNSVTVRGFHGDYEAHVYYNGRELTNLKQTFTLAKGSSTQVNIRVHN